MSTERMKILEMLSEGKISAAEADELLRAVEEAPQGRAQAGSGGSRAAPRYLRIQVDGGGVQGRREKVNIRVPLQILRSGVRLAAFLPDEARHQIEAALEERGLDLSLDQLGQGKPEHVESLIESLGELSLEVNDEADRVRIFCE